MATDNEIFRLTGAMQNGVHALERIGEGVEALERIADAFERIADAVEMYTGMTDGGKVDATD